MSKKSTKGWSDYRVLQYIRKYAAKKGPSWCAKKCGITKNMASQKMRNLGIKMSDSDRSALAVASGIRGNPPTQRDDGIYDDLEMTPRDKHLERLFLGAGARK